jgi:hypothetical protein
MVKAIIKLIINKINIDKMKIKMVAASKIINKNNNKKQKQLKLKLQNYEC